MEDVTYSESLKIAWSIMWRGILLGGGGGFLVGFILGFIGSALGFSTLAIQTTITILVAVVGTLWLYPLVIRMVLKKQFRGFKLQVIRSPT